MSMLIYLKNPTIMLLAEGPLDERMEKQLNRAVGGAIKVSILGQSALVPVKTDCNIVYVKEATEQEVEEFQKRKAQETASRESGVTIARPELRFPLGMKGKG